MKTLITSIVIALVLSSAASAGAITLTTDDTRAWAKQCHSLVNQNLKESILMFYRLPLPGKAADNFTGIRSSYSFWPAKVNTSTGSMSLDIKVKAMQQQNGWERKPDRTETVTCEWSSTVKSKPSKPHSLTSTDMFGIDHKWIRLTNCSIVEGWNGKQICWESINKHNGYWFEYTTERISEWTI